MNLVPLFEEALEFQNYNGTVLSNGKVAVFYIGRTRLADIFNDIEGLSPAENPRVLDNLGMGPIYVNPAFDYEMVVYDAYDNELFSVKKYVLSKGEHSTANVVVTPSEHIAVSAWTIGDVQVYMPYLVGDIGKTYEGILPIVVNNDLNRISAQHIPLGVQEPLYFVEDSETACIIGFSGQTVPEGTMTESALGFENNKITGYNGSAFSAGNEYEAGSYVDIDGHTISVTGLSPVPVDTASTGLVASVSADITAMIPDTSDMATQTWVNEQGFLTAIPSEYVTENTLQSGLSSKLDSTAFSSVSGNFLTAHQSLDGLMSADLLEISDNKITGYNGTAFAGQGGVSGDFELSAGSGISIVDYPLEQKTVISVTAQGGNPEVEQAVIDNSATWNNVSAKLDTTAFSTVSSDFLTALPQDLVYTADIADMATTGDLTGKQDSLTFGYKDTAISSIDNSALYDNSAHARINTLAGRISDLSSNKLDTSAFSDVSGTFLTAHQDLSDYQTTADMTAYATVESLTAKQDAGDYLSATDSANFLLTSDSGNFYPMNENPSGYLTAHQSLADYQLTADMTGYLTTADSANFLTAVPAGTMNESAFGYDANDKISGYNGSAFAGGSEVPEGVMVESGLEYNAVNEISGYNGSAIAQYGAEKQWLVHDDTLVHASNSAQYALGVNLSAVAQLLGVDETVLWSGSITWGQTAALSDSVKNYDRIRFYIEETNRHRKSTNELVLTNLSNANLREFALNMQDATTSYFGNYFTVYNVNEAGDSLTSVSGRQWWYSPWTSTAINGSIDRGLILTRVVGIGRKS